MIQKEHGIIGRTARQHVAADPHMHPIVQSGGRLGPTLHDIPESCRRSKIPIGFVIGARAQRMFDFRRSRQCSDLRRKSSSQPTGDPPQIAGSVCINPHQKFVGSSLRIGERPVNQRCPIAPHAIRPPNRLPRLLRLWFVAIHIPCPVGQTKSGIIQHSLQVLFQHNQKIAMPRQKHRAFMGRVARRLAGWRHRHHGSRVPDHQSIVGTQARRGLKFILQQQNPPDIFVAGSRVSGDVPANDGHGSYPFRFSFSQNLLETVQSQT